MNNGDLKFPEGFLWGASTSAHQVEGGNTNNWSEWEKKNAVRLARQAEKRYSHLSVWEDIKSQAQDPQNYISGKAADHFHRFRDDFALAKDMNHNAARFSIEWSRIEPEEGVFNETVISHYADVLHFLQALGIEPFVTLWHWPVPVWVSKKGGWTKGETTDYFLRYVERVAGAFKNSVHFWAILNEPLIYSALSFLKGEWPPQQNSVNNYFKVVSHLAEAQHRAYRIIKEISPASSVGSTQILAYFEAYENTAWNRSLKRISDHFQYRFLEKTKHAHDFIGLDYYFHNRIRGWWGRNENRYRSDMGWELYPEGIYYVLRDITKRFKKPIYITEHGLADGEDTLRAWYIRESLHHVHRAIQEGSDVRGYLHWSLLDNFEWDKGFWPRFGLLEVDYKTFERRMRPSAHFYADICKENAITPEILEKHKDLFIGF